MLLDFDDMADVELKGGLRLSGPMRELAEFMQAHDLSGHVTTWDHRAECTVVHAVFVDGRAFDPNPVTVEGPAQPRLHLRSAPRVARRDIGDGRRCRPFTKSITTKAARLAGQRELRAALQEL